MSDIDDFGTAYVKARGKGEATRSNRVINPCEEVPNQSVTTDSEYQQYSVIHEGAYYATGKTEQRLPIGTYRVLRVSPPIEFIFEKMQNTFDEFIPMGGYIVQEVIDDIEDFWNCKSRFRDFNFIHKRGILLYGPAGGGKTVAIQEISRKVMDRGGVIFFYSVGDIDCAGFARSLERFRKVEPDRPVICIFEDIDAIISSVGDTELLELLDGGLQIDGVLMLATTNYPEKLDRRIIARPRRFDRIIFVDNPPDFARERFFKAKLPQISEEELKLYVDKTKGFSFAALTELVISVHCLGNEFDQTIDILNKIMKSKKPASDDFIRSGVGFN